MNYLEINHWGINYLEISCLHKTIYVPLRCQDLTAFEEDPTKWATEQTRTTV